jgi:hypothetical protein
VNHFESFKTCLFGSASVQFYAVPQNLFVRSDFSERDAISYAGIKD